jgi:predicted ATPase
LWDEALPFSQCLELLPLNPQDSLALVDEILQKLADSPAALREMVVKNADGNPFYLEELVKMLIDDGVIQVGEASEEDEAHTWRMDPNRLAVLRLPSTLAGVLQARFESLPAEAPGAASASVIGRTFWGQALSYVSAQTTAEEQSGDQPSALSRPSRISARRSPTCAAGR